MKVFIFDFYGIGSETSRIFHFSKTKYEMK